MPFTVFALNNEIEDCSAFLKNFASAFQKKINIGEMKRASFLNLLISSLQAFHMLLSFVSIKATKKFCTGSGHVNGVWHRKSPNMLNKKAFECCDSRTDAKATFTNSPNCTSSDTDSDVVGIVYFQRGSPFTGRGCECDHRLGQNKVHDREKWAWSPSDCALQQWDASQFCQVLQNRSILMVGDSTMEQSAATLIAMVLAAEEYMVGCASRLSYARSDYLIWERFGKEKTWVQNMDKESPDILILTAGAWLEDTGDMETVLNSITREIDLRRSKSGRVPVILWKTQNPGHFDCHAFTAPITPGEENALNRSSAHKYNWHLHKKFDAQARLAMMSINGSTIDMSPMYYRPDSHPGSIMPPGGDCLHYCMAGPLDLFPQLLFHKLMHDWGSL